NIGDDVYRSPGFSLICAHLIFFVPLNLLEIDGRKSILFYEIAIGLRNGRLCQLRIEARCFIVIHHITESIEILLQEERFIGGKGC
ncbi:MAG TPA: hypothetical protein DCR02_06365, partial [Sphaerochaeta sp.]|nr:hypothetical protein [Sphaerochaeta sp.]